MLLFILMSKIRTSLKFKDVSVSRDPESNSKSKPQKKLIILALVVIIFLVTRQKVFAMDPSDVWSVDIWINGHPVKLKDTVPDKLKSALSEQKLKVIGTINKIMDELEKLVAAEIKKKNGPSPKKLQSFMKISDGLEKLLDAELARKDTMAEKVKYTAPASKNLDIIFVSSLMAYKVWRLITFKGK